MKANAMKKKSTIAPYTRYQKRPYDYSHLSLSHGLKNGDGSTTVWPKCRISGKGQK